MATNESVSVRAVREVEHAAAVSKAASQKIVEELKEAYGIDPTCLTRAADLVDGPRRTTYGHPNDNHRRTAEMWSAYLGIPISLRQVCMLNILQKCARDAHAAKQDNLDDICGWARNAEIVSE